MSNKDKKIIPRGMWVLVKPDINTSTETANGLLLPANEEREQKAYGEILSVGNEVKGLKKGEVVIYGAYAGENIKFMEDDNEVEYKLLLDEDIIAKIQ